LRWSLHLANFGRRRPCGFTRRADPAGIPPQHPGFAARKSNRADPRFLDFGRIEARWREIEMSELAKKIAVSALLQPALAFAAGEASFGFQPPQSVIARQIVDLHALVLGICIVIAAVVFGVMFYSIVRFRKAAGREAKQFHGNTTIEMLWTVIPCLIVVGIAYPATKTVIEMKDTTNPDLTIKITGYQWKWRYTYVDDGIDFYSSLSTPRDQIENAAPKGEHYLLEVDRPLVVPVGKKIRILTTADDVIHSWFVPALAVKQDAVPGFVRDSWFKVDAPGIYRGACTELCGKEHGFMPVVVEAMPEKDYQDWVADQHAKSAPAAAAPQ
jgi:cytochrome c oxidase subunit 2